MKFTLDWLKDYLKTDASADEVADMLTRIGLEVEDIEYPIVPIAAKIIECENIPGTSLHLLKVNDGTDELRQVVCGAPNARAGLVSALALPGCKVGDMEIKSGKIRGHLSDGMMCSARELGLGDDHDGIIELPADSEIGGPLVGAEDFPPLREPPSAVFTAGITPNRPDYLSVRGIARDLAATGIGEFKEEFDYSKFGEMPAGKRKAKIENYAACPAYYLCEINNVKIAPSNTEIATRLAAIGINPKNAAIDATNYVCHDIGQPMHCFDADEIKGDIIIRNAKSGEKFTDLFGAEHELADTDLVIADSDGILALAGIIGGARGMTTDKTKNIMLESAYFDPVTVRKTAKRIGVSTDASYRYERGINPTIAFQGIAQAATKIANACGGEIYRPFRDIDAKNPAVSFMDNIEPRKYSQNEYAFLQDPRRIEYAPGLFKQKTGIDLPADRQREILERLGFGIEITQHSTLNTQHWRIAPPPARVDMEIPENIVAELIRIYGYENIKITAQKIKVQEPKINGVKLLLAARGLNELVSYKFGDSKKEILLSDRPRVKIMNPIIDTFDTVRNGLVQGMLDVIANNDRFRRSNLNLFELGAVFDGDMPERQHDQLIIARTGIAGRNIGARHGRPVEIYDVRADLLALFSDQESVTRNQLMVENDDNPPKWAHPFRSGRIVKDGAVVAQFAELHPAIAKKFGIKTKVVLGLVDDLSAVALAKVDVVNVGAENFPPNGAQYLAPLQGRKSQNDFPDFPLITRDFAFIVDNKVSPADITAAIAAANPIVYETNVFDVFDMGDGKKSVAFELVLQPTGNMSDGDLAEFQTKVIAEVESKFNARIRDK
jgi:phenylalanyl-tRNA synthetase beta chain